MLLKTHENSFNVQFVVLPVGESEREMNPIVNVVRRERYQDCLKSVDFYQPAVTRTTTRWSHTHKRRAGEVGVCVCVQCLAVKRV